jgi:hypothetical protein
MVSLADDGILVNDHGSNHRIGHNRATTTSGKIESAVHIERINHKMYISRVAICGYPVGF